MKISGSFRQYPSGAAFEGSSTHSRYCFALVNTESRCGSFLLPSRSNMFLKMVLVLRLFDLQSGSPTWCDHTYTYFFVLTLQFHKHFRHTSHFGLYINPTQVYGARLWTKGYRFLLEVVPFECIVRISTQRAKP